MQYPRQHPSRTLGSRTLFTALAILVFVTLALPTLAQAGEIYGTVVRANGSPAAGQEVCDKSTGNCGAVQQNGQYSLRAGSGNVQIEVPGVDGTVTVRVGTSPARCDLRISGGRLERR